MCIYWTENAIEPPKYLGKTEPIFYLLVNDGKKNLFD